MLIATVSKLDNWIPTHCVRFVTSCRKYNPGIEIALVAPDEPEGNKYYAQAKELFDRVVVVKPEVFAGRLLFYDRLRSSLPMLLDSDSVLYIDPDTDILAPLGDVDELVGDSELGWVRNSMMMQFVVDYHKTMGWHDSVCIEPGFLLLRRNLIEEFDAILREGNIDIYNVMAPGMLAWDTLRRRLPSVRLPDEMNVTRVEPEVFGVSRTIHYTGPFKAWRPYIRWSDDMPRHIWFGNKKQWNMEKYNGENDSKGHQVQDREQGIGMVSVY